MVAFRVNSEWVNKCFMLLEFAEHISLSGCFKVALGLGLFGEEERMVKGAACQGGNQKGHEHNGL